MQKSSENVLLLGNNLKMSFESINLLLNKETVKTPIGCRR